MKQSFQAHPRFMFVGRGNIIEIRKEFLMDLTSRDRFRSFKLKIPGVRTLSDFFCLQYQRHKRLVRPVLIVRGLFFKFGIKSSFMKSPHKGTSHRHLYYGPKPNSGETKL